MYSYFWTRKHAILGTRLVDGRLYAVRVWRARRVCGRQSAGRTVSAVFESRSERASNGKSDIHIQKGYRREILLISWGQLTFTTYISIAWRSRVELVGYRSTCPSSVPIMACPPPSLQQNRRRACAGGRGLPGVKVNSPGAMWWLLSASRLCCRSVAAQHTNTHHSVYAPGTTHSPPPPKHLRPPSDTHLAANDLRVCAHIAWHACDAAYTIRWACASGTNKHWKKFVGTLGRRARERSAFKMQSVLPPVWMEQC